MFFANIVLRATNQIFFDCGAQPISTVATYGRRAINLVILVATALKAPNRHFWTIPPQQFLPTQAKEWRRQTYDLGGRFVIAAQKDASTTAEKEMAHVSSEKEWPTWSVVKNLQQIEEKSNYEQKKQPTNANKIRSV